MHVRRAILFASAFLMAAPATAQQGPTPYCWLVFYKWTDYNQRGDTGTYTLVTNSPMLSTEDRVRAEVEINRQLPKTTTAKVRNAQPIDCPEALKNVDWRDWVRNGLKRRAQAGERQY